MANSFIHKKAPAQFPGQGEFPQRVSVRRGRSY
jgi:hypothetical protein